MSSKAFVLAALAGTLLSTAAFAKQGHQWACSDAVQQFCSDVKPGGGRVLQCLDEHKSDLTPSCITASQKAEAHHQAFLGACSNDISTLCKDQDTGHGQLWKCLKSQDDQLSSACKAFTSKSHHDEVTPED